MASRDPHSQPGGAHGRGADPRSIPELMADLAGDVSALLRSEGRLIRAEVTEAGRRLASGGELIAAGIVLILVAALVLVQALVLALAEWVGPAWASVIVGGTLLAVGGLLALIGRRRLSTASLAPERTMNQIQQDIRLKEKI